VVGGLITSTMLTLLLLPLIYEWSEMRAESRKAASEPEPTDQNDPLKTHAEVT